MHPRWLVRFAAGSLALLLPAAAPAQGVYPRAIASGLGGFGFAPMSGSVGYGASFSGYGYVFVPGVGFQPAFTFTPPPYPRLAPGALGGRRGGAADARPAVVTFTVPPGSELWIGTWKTDKPGPERTFRLGPLRPGVVHSYQVRIRWRQAGRSVQERRRVDVRAGDRVTVDFTRPAP
jgi:uncharacterized protein (TIGR03000 family)